jgi:hypothetical protein
MANFRILGVFPNLEGMKHMHKYLTAVVVCLSLGCGSDDEGDFRAPPSEELLCSLTIGESSRDDIAAALGPATAVTSSGGLSLLQYEYGRTDRVALSVSEVSSLMIVVNEDDRFEDATAINVPFPDCWTVQIEARDDAREREFSEP